jgi:hypothetical protein
MRVPFLSFSKKNKIKKQNPSVNVRVYPCSSVANNRIVMPTVWLTLGWLNVINAVCKPNELLILCVHTIAGPLIAVYP